MSSLNQRLETGVRAIHTWVGVTAGTLFCLMSLSGSLLVFRADLERGLRPPWRAASQARPESVLTEAASNIRRRWPDAKIVSLNLPSQSGEPYAFDTRLPDGRSADVFTDSRSGEVLGTFGLPWLDWIVDLHHNLHLGPAGKKLVGVIGICLFCTSLTGLALWLLRGPNLRRAVRIRTGGSWKVVSFDLHRFTGLLANALLLIVSLTGIYLAYPNTIQRALGVAPAKTRHKLNAGSERGERERKSSKPIEELLAAAKQAVPGGSVRQLRFAGKTSGQVTARLWVPGDFRPGGSNRVMLDPSTARVLQIDRASDWSAMQRLTESATPVHYAEWGGPILQVLWAFIGFAPPILFISGFLIWLQPYLARRRAARRASAERLISVKELVS